MTDLYATIDSPEVSFYPEVLGVARETKVKHTRCLVCEKPILLQADGGKWELTLALFGGETHYVVHWCWPALRETEADLDRLCAI